MKEDNLYHDEVQKRVDRDWNSFSSRIGGTKKKTETIPEKTFEEDVVIPEYFLQYQYKTWKKSHAGRIYVCWEVHCARQDSDFYSRLAQGEGIDLDHAVKKMEIEVFNREEIEKSEFLPWPPREEEIQKTDVTCFGDGKKTYVERHKIEERGRT